MKLLYTNHGILTPTRVRQLLECGMDIQVAGPAGEIAGVVEGGPSTRRASRDAAIEADMVDFDDLDREEREAQELADLMADDDYHRKAFFLDDEKDDPFMSSHGAYGDEDEEPHVIQRSEDDWLDEARSLDDPEAFGDEPSDEDMFLGGTDSLDPSVEDAISSSRAHDTKSKDFIGPEEDDDFGGHTFSDEEWFLEEDSCNKESLREEKRMVNKIKSVILECIRREELEHSQTGFADMQPAVVSEEVKEVAPPGMEDVVLGLKKKFGEKSPKPFQIAWSMYNKKKGKKKSSGKKKVNESSLVSEDWRAVYRRFREASSALSAKWPEMFDTMTKKEGMPGNKAMAKIRSMEKSIDNLSQDLQLFKNVAEVKKKAAMAMSKNSKLAEFIPAEIGGKF